ncbi:hypothetical protein ACKWTF_001917 [Chironomus riparius]
MSKVLDALNNTYNEFYYVNKDPRATGKILLESPPTTIMLLILTYLAVICVGPKIMKKRKAVELKGILVVYNLVQVIVNFAYTTLLIIVMKNRGQPLIGCHKISYSDQVSWNFFYGYFLIKILDFTDTILIILRKSERQLTLLHCYHHISILIVAYFFPMWFTSAIPLFGTFLNSLIHLFMYSYYLTSAVFPKWQKLKWIKIILTKLQILQFIVGVALIEYYYWTNPSCHVPNFFHYFMISYLSIFIYMFVSFYRKTYFKNLDKLKLK